METKQQFPHVFCGTTHAPGQCPRAQTEPETKQQKHTELPWHVAVSGVCEGNIYGPDGIIIASIGENYPNSHANARYIVLSANYHERLKEQIRELLRIVAYGRTHTPKDFSYYLYGKSGSGFVHNTIREAESLLAELDREQ